MPYIDANARKSLAHIVAEIKKVEFHHPGELNYLLTSICNEYVRKNGCNYAMLSDVIASLECAKLEYYRRTLVPYEDKKIQENGDLD